MKYSAPSTENRIVSRCDLCPTAQIDERYVIFISLTDFKIQPSDYPDHDVASLPVRPQLSAAALQAAFDGLVKDVVVPKLNALLDELASASGADNIGKTISGVSADSVGGLLELLHRDKADLDSPTFSGTPTAPSPEVTTDDASIATTAFVHDVVDSAVFVSEAADMQKAVYDPDERCEDVFAAMEALLPTVLEVTLPVSGWELADGVYTQTVEDDAFAEDGFVYVVGPAPADFDDYAAACVRMGEITTDGWATFQADALPASDLTAQVLIAPVRG